MSGFDLCLPSTWFGWWSSFVAEPSNVIAAAAVFVSLMSAWVTNKHGRLSVLPAFATWAEYPSARSSECTITLSNKGFGPGIVEAVEIWNGDKRGEGRSYRAAENAVRDAIGPHIQGEGNWALPGPGQAIGQGERIVLAAFTVDAELAQGGVEELSNYLSALSLVVRYRDIYNRKWVYTVHQLVGYTYRRAWWSLRYVWDRRIKRRNV